jgi:hypothetical protein
MREETGGGTRVVLRSLAALATLYTLGVHVYLAAAPSSPDPEHRGLFWLAAAGFLVGLIGLYVPRDWIRMGARLLLIGTAAGAIVAYLVLYGTTFTPLALSAKLDEAGLIVLLIIDGSLAIREVGGRSQRQVESPEGATRQTSAA